MFNSNNDNKTGNCLGAYSTAQCIKQDKHNRTHIMGIKIKTGTHVNMQLKNNVHIVMGSSIRAHACSCTHTQHTFLWTDMGEGRCWLTEIFRGKKCPEFVSEGRESKRCLVT